MMIGVNSSWKCANVRSKEQILSHGSLQSIRPLFGPCFCICSDGGKAPQVSSNDNLNAHRDGKRQASIGHKLLSTLQSSLLKRKLIPPGERVLVAVSGGQDSISLIYLLCRLRSAYGLQLGIAHCDHQWSHLSRSQASHVAQIASHLGLDYYQAVSTRNVRGESAARRWRYNILQRLAHTHGYGTIVTAHTGSDRVETLLHNLFRGSGLHGLHSLSWKRLISSSPDMPNSSAFNAGSTVAFVEDAYGRRKEAIHSPIALVRPCLDMSRMELTKFCEAEKLPLWPDPSNFSMEIRRNIIRHQLLPFLRKCVQSSIDKSLARIAEILCGEDAFLESLCESIRKEAESFYSNSWGTGRKLDLVFVQNLPIALQRRVIKQYVESFTCKSFGFDHVERLRTICIVGKCYNGFHLSLPGDFEVLFQDKILFLRKKCG